MDRGPNRINVTFTITGAEVRPRYHWVGEGITNDWIIPMPENPPGSRKWTTAPEEFSPQADRGVVSFEAVFSWRGAECHALWSFPYSLTPKNNYVNVVFETTREHLLPRCWWKPPV
jgi:hypothetical protein